MADIELVIKIPEEMAYRFKHEGEQKHYDYHTVIEACINGIPLPKGHGRLIDADDIALIDEQFYTPSDYYVAEGAIEDAQTIIDADKEE